MSSSLPVGDLAPRPTGGAGPRLAVVPRPAARPARAPFVLLVLGLLAGGLVSLLLLNTALAQDAFTVHDLTTRLASLSDRAQTLEQQLAVEEAPDRLAQRARALGMVPNPDPVFLRPSDGAVLGVPRPAPPPPAPQPTAAKPAPQPAATPPTKPAAQPAAQPTPAAKAKPPATPAGTHR